MVDDGDASGGDQDARFVVAVAWKALGKPAKAMVDDLLATCERSFAAEATVDSERPACQIEGPAFCPSKQTACDVDLSSFAVLKYGLPFGELVERQSRALLENTSVLERFFADSEADAHCLEAEKSAACDWEIQRHFSAAARRRKMRRAWKRSTSGCIPAVAVAVAASANQADLLV